MGRITYAARYKVWLHSVLYNWDIHYKVGTWKRKGGASFFRSSSLSSSSKTITDEWYHAKRWFYLSNNKNISFILPLVHSMVCGKLKGWLQFHKCYYSVYQTCWFCTINENSAGQESSLEQFQWNIELCFLNGWLRSSPQGCSLSFIAYLNYSQVTGIQSSNTETLQVWSCRAKIVSKWSGKWCKMPVLYTFSRSMLSQYSYLTVVAMLIDWTVIVCLQWCCI